VFTIKPITKTQIDALEKELASAGTTITPNAAVDGGYVISGHGITATAVFDDSSEALAVSVMHKPFFVPESAIQNGIRDALKKIAV